MKKYLQVVSVWVWFLLLPSFSLAKLQVVTTTQDLAAIAREIGKDSAEIFTIAKGYQDPHFVDPKPSYLLKLKRADVLIIVGLELEVGWLPPLLQNARNSRILPGHPGLLDASEGCDVLQKPTGTVDRSMGDVHPFGNPHYWTNPENGRMMARQMAAKFSELDPAHQSVYQENLKNFETQLTDKKKQWEAMAASFKGTKVVTYHNSWPNFIKAFGLDVVNHVEPKPGIPPSPAHVQRLTAQIRREQIPLILVEPYFDAKLPSKIGAATGARVLIFPSSVGGLPSIQTYFDLFDYNLKLLQEAVGGTSQ